MKIFNLVLSSIILKKKGYFLILIIHVSFIQAHIICLKQIVFYIYTNVQ